jgi:hypothetical protein
LGGIYIHSGAFSVWVQYIFCGGLDQDLTIVDGVRIHSVAFFDVDESAIFGNDPRVTSTYPYSVEIPALVRAKGLGCRCTTAESKFPTMISGCSPLQVLEMIADDDNHGQFDFDA